MPDNPEHDHPSQDSDDLPDLSIAPAAAKQADPVGHIPVMLGEVLEHLAPAPGKTILDCTTGRGGHAQAVLPHLAPGGRYIGLDIDGGNLEFARTRLADPNVKLDLVRANFGDGDQALQKLGVDRIDGLLADLGFSSNQMDDPSRGLSFSVEAPLDMRLDDRLTMTAADLLATYQERELADLLFQYGQERFSRRIARKIVEQRRDCPIKTTGQLRRICAWAYGGRSRHQKIDPATRSFMALRIAVNGELERLEQLLAWAPRMMAPGGRLVIISFHSLEDGMVKRALRGWNALELGRVLTRKPLVPDDLEMAQNPRSRSAKLRAFCFEPPVGHEAIGLQ